MNEYHDQELRRCLAECIDCHRACLAAAVGPGARELGGDHLRLLLDCAQMCQTTTDFMLRGSNLHGYACGLCAHVCKVCGDRCDRLIDAPDLRACAALCHTCADTCLRVSKAAAYESILV